MVTSMLHETKGPVVTFGLGHGVTLFRGYLLSLKGQYEYMNACVTSQFVLFVASAFV